MGMQAATEVKRERRRAPRPGWRWLYRLLRQPAWAPPARPALNLHQLRRIAYL